MTKLEPWTCWDGYGPHPTDGLMRCMRIGPRGKGGLYTEPESADIAGTKDDMEHCVLAYNATYAAGINPEAVKDLVKLLEEAVKEGGGGMENQGWFMSIGWMARARAALAKAKLEEKP
jgi:hypothetical protein